MFKLGNLGELFYRFLFNLVGFDIAVSEVICITVSGEMESPRSQRWLSHWSVGCWVCPRSLAPR